MVLADRADYAGIVGVYRQFSLAPVDEHGELYLLRSAEVHDRVYSGPYGAACMEHIIDKDNSHVVDIEWYLRFFDLGRSQFGYVVAVHRYIEHAERRLHAFDTLYLVLYPVGKIDAPRPDPDKAQRARPPVLLEYLMGDPRYRAVYGFLIEDDLFLHLIVKINSSRLAVLDARAAFNTVPGVGNGHNAVISCKNLVGTYGYTFPALDAC